MRTFFRSSIGLKAVMAVSGLLMVGYLLTHVAANMLVFRGPTLINKYSAVLHSQPALLWVARAVLIVALVAHVWSAVVLTRRERAARPIAYGMRRPQVATFASRTIRWGGLAILFFLVWHILQFTTGTIHPSAFVEGDPHGNVVRAFQIPWVVGLYVVSMAAVGLHLFHGTWSAFRSLGLVKPSEHALRHKTSLLVAGLVWLGFTIIPLAIFAGVGR
jgi:succinate dehydrogenase / fumarate reductase cytochrome b subunit